MSEQEFYTKADLEAIQKLHLYSGLPISQCKAFAEALAMMMVYDQLDGSPTRIPLLGDFMVSLKDIEDVVDGQRLLMETEVEYTSFFTRSLGQLLDRQQSDIERLQLKRLKEKLEGALDEG